MANRQALTKTLTQTDVEKTLQVPAEWLPVLPGPLAGKASAQLRFLDKLGFCWEFWLDLHQIGGNDLQGRSAAVLEPREWLDFVANKGLKAGDKIVVDTTNNDGCEFRDVKFRLAAQKLDSDGVTWLDV